MSKAFDTLAKERPRTETPNGIIRRGQKRPFRKHPREQIDQRIVEVEMLLGQSLRRCQIHKIICEKYDIHWRTCDQDIVCARTNILERIRRNREDFRAESLTFYETVIMGTHDIQIKMQARKRIDELIGADAPRAVIAKIDVGGEAARELDSGVLASLELVYGKDLAQQAIEAHATVKRVTARTGSIDPVVKKPKLALA